MEREPEFGEYSDGTRRPPDVQQDRRDDRDAIDRRQEQYELDRQAALRAWAVSERIRADRDREDARQKAVRSEQLARESEDARQRAESTRDPAERRAAESEAYDLGQQSSSATSDAATGYESAEIGYDASSADLGSANAAAARAQDAQEARAQDTQVRDAQLQDGQAQDAGYGNARTAPAYDSPQRRGEMAEHLNARGIDHEVVASRVRADMGQAQPATAISKTRSARAQTMGARNGPGRNRPRQAQRVRPAGRAR